MYRKNQDNFIESCISGLVLLEEIDDWIDKWHDNSQGMELHEYLGMNWEEYSSWISMPEILPFIVTAHKDNKKVITLLKEIESLPIAARSGNRQKAKELVKWLESHSEA